MTRILNEEDIKKVCKKFCAEKSINELSVVVSILQIKAENYMDHLRINKYVNNGETAKYLNLTKMIEFINLHISTTLEKIKQDSIPKKEEEPIDPNVANIGDTVTVKNSYGEDDVFTLYPENRDVYKGEISIVSPIGKVLSGGRKGDYITAIIPSGIYEGEIIDIKKPDKIIETEEPKVLELC